jgi:hypothetical protein
MRTKKQGLREQSGTERIDPLFRSPSTAFSILVFTESMQKSGFFLKKKHLRLTLDVNK